MINKSAWAYVDPLTVEQAACLWAEVDPAKNWKFDAELRSQVLPYIQLLSGGIASGELPPDPRNHLERIAHFETSNVSREALRNFAAKRKVHPAFLFDTTHPTDSEPPPASGETKEQGKSRGGRPVEYDWDAMTGEILRIADLDKLPDKQADLITKLLDWFGQHFGDELPAESNVKQRVSAFYRLWRRAKEMEDRNPHR